MKPHERYFIDAQFQSLVNAIVGNVLASGLPFDNLADAAKVAEIELTQLTEKPSNAFETELTALLNRYSAENESNTPDFILASFLMSCLSAWNKSVQWREEWYGRNADLVKGELK